MMCIRNKLNAGHDQGCQRKCCFGLANLVAKSEEARERLQC